MKKILIVDDDRTIRQTILRHLQKFNYEVTAVESGMAAIDVLKGGNIDLVLLDQMMPKMDGIETFRQIIKKISNYPPVIMFTAYGSMELAVAFMKDGGSDFIEKPVDFDILNIKIIQAINARELEKNNEKLEELNMLKTQFISNISHELRTPLTSITSVAEILLDEACDLNNKETLKSLEIINKETDHLNQLIEKALHFKNL